MTFFEIVVLDYIRPMGTEVNWITADLLFVQLANVVCKKSGNDAVSILFVVPSIRKKYNNPLKV